MKNLHPVHSLVRLTGLAVLSFWGPLAHAQLPPAPASSAQVANFEYDAEGNPTKTIVAPNTSGMAFPTVSGYDTLNRLRRVQDAKSGVTQIELNGQDLTTKVTDPRNLATQYSIDGLGNLANQVSPDTGTTTINTVDPAGNVTRKTDARGVVVDYVYDDLGRLVRVSTPSDHRAFTWTYDQTGAAFGYGVGRLTTAASPYISTQFRYDALGRITQTTQNIAEGPTLTVGYGYDAAGHVTSITYPSGRVISVTYANGLPTTLTATSGSPSGPLLSNIQFSPFGDVQGWDWNLATGTRSHQRVFDTYGRMVRYPLGSLVRDLIYDEANRIKNFYHYDASTGAPQAVFDQSFGYDELGRLKQAYSATTTRSFNYDANGNRTLAAVGSTVQTYATSATSNRLDSISNPVRNFGYDNAGNITTDSDSGTGYTGTYNWWGRLDSMKQGPAGVAFAYDAIGQRVGRVGWSVDATVAKSLPSRSESSALRNEGGGNTDGIIGGSPATPAAPWAPVSVPAGSHVEAASFYAYDLQGHVIGAYSSTGAAIAEYVWLGDVPVAVYEDVGAGTQAFYVEADHINTPRVLIDAQGNTRWRWMSEPFGASAPETQPTANLPAVAYNLRMPGQQYEPFGGKFYNYFRDYDPTTGRYVQSDPIGLGGGVNTYSYVNGNPVSGIDPRGLDCSHPGKAIDCSFPEKGGPSFEVPTQQGFPQSLMASANYHKYSVRRALGNADPECVRRGIINNPTPGNPRPATTSGTLNNAKVLGQDNLVTSYLTTDLTSRTQMVVNITNPNSLFASGYAARLVANGFAYTYGEGTNWKQSPYAGGRDVQIYANELLWGRQMQEIIDSCTCK